MTGMKLRIPKGLLVIVSFILVFASAEAFASIDYTVKKGDTLYRIAKKYDVSVSALQAENGVSARKLRPGMTLTIPSDEKAAPEVKEQAVKEEPVEDEEIEEEEGEEEEDLDEEEEEDDEELEDLDDEEED